MARRFNHTSMNCATYKVFVCWFLISKLILSCVNKNFRAPLFIAFIVYSFFVSFFVVVASYFTHYHRVLSLAPQTFRPISNRIRFHFVLPSVGMSVCVIVSICTTLISHYLESCFFSRTNGEKQQQSKKKKNNILYFAKVNTNMKNTKLWS